MHFRWALLGALLMTCPVFGQPPTAQAAGDTSSESTAVAESPDDPFAATRLEPFVDGVMAGLFRSHHLAGAVVVIVKDGSIRLAKGYGSADMASGRPVDAGSTLFRIASISKLFTWTAVMQLEQEGKVRLNTDVNEYLTQLSVPATYDDPVTLGTLMSHTAGFEDRVLGLITTDVSAVPPFEQVLREELPSRVRPPGRVPAYSNYGAALAALVVQDVSGMPWSQFIQTRILDPLGMTRTVLTQPVPPEFSGDLARGYVFVHGALTESPFEVVPLLPAGGMSASGVDMAHFMLAHLNLGVYGGERILAEATERRMQAVSYQPDPRIPGMAHGFVLTRRNGRLSIGHRGDLRTFHSDLSLVPSEQLGLFVSFNSEEGSEARDELVDALFGYWFPEDLQSPSAADAGAAQRAVGLAGVYRSTRRPVTTVDKFAEAGRYLTVRSLGGGKLETQLSGREPRQWIEVEPYYFRESQGGGALLFQADSGPGSMRAFFADPPIFAYDRLSWYQEPRFQLLLLTGEVLVFLTTLLFPFVRRYVERTSDRVLARREPAHPLARGLASSLSLVNLVFLAGLAYIFRDPGAILAGVPPGLSALLVLPLVSGALTVVLFVVAVFAWRGAYWQWAARLHFSLVTVAAVTFLWQVSYWNLLGWQYS